MYKIGIKITNRDEIELKPIAQTLQLFILEGDYSIHSIIKQIKEDKIVELDIDTDDGMPDFIASLDDLDNDLVEYQIYELENNEYKEITKDDLGWMLFPLWIKAIINISFIGYLIMIIFEIYPIYDLYSVKYTLGTVSAIVASIVTAIIPIVGSIIAYISTTTIWQWGVIHAIIIYFWYYIPIILFFIYALYMIIKNYGTYYWYKYRYPEFEL